MPLFKLCPSKFEKESDNEAPLKSYSSNSSISSDHSTAEDNTSNNHVLIEDDDEEGVVDDDGGIPIKEQQPQNEFLLLNKFQTSLKENIFKSEDTNTVSSSDDSIGKQENNLIILEICVDCYQMMEGVTVNAESNEKSKEQKQDTQSYSTTSSTSSSTSSTLDKRSQKVFNQKNFLKSIYLNKNEAQNMASSCSSDAIVMNSLSNVNIVNSVLPPDILINNQRDINSKDSPLLGKKSFGKLQSHSTPSTSTSNLGGVLNKPPETELSHIVVNDEDESFSKKTSNIKVTREKLTLNLQPVYNSASSSSS